MHVHSLNSVFLTDTQRHSVKQCEACNRCGVQTFWWGFGVFQWARSRSSHKRENCRWNRQKRRHLLLWKGEVALLLVDSHTSTSLKTFNHRTIVGLYYKGQLHWHKCLVLDSELEACSMGIPYFKVHFCPGIGDNLCPVNCTKNTYLCICLYFGAFSIGSIATKQR